MASKKDTLAKKYLQDNERFADMFNYYLYKGQQVILPETLSDRDSVEDLALGGENGAAVVYTKRVVRDLLKRAVIKTDGEKYYVLLGIENQSDIHYAMPVRVMLYDSINYFQQMLQIAKLHRENKDYGETPAQFLSGFHKNDRIIPVITLVIYWGNDKWDGPRDLYDMVGAEYSELREYINNYRIHLFCLGDAKDYGLFRTALGKVFRIINASSDENSLNEVLSSDAAYKSIDYETLSIIMAFTGDKIRMNRKKGNKNMSKAWDDHYQSGVREGEKRGEERGEKRGEKQGEINILKRIMQQMNLSAEQVLDYAGIPNRERGKYLKELPKS